jgi:hypothetical protein
MGDFVGETGMTCEEFATAGLDLGASGEDGLLQRTAREHVRECPHCATLHENWLSLREDLHALGVDSADAQAPSRVEMRLRQEFRTKHKTVKTRRFALIAGWSLAAATALFCVITFVNWRLHKGEPVARTGTAVTHTPVKGNTVSSSENVFAAPDLGEVLVASNGSGEFTLLPGSMPPAPEDTTVVRVEMQRAALGSLGLTVNEERAGDLIQVDLLIGDDGLPQAVRLPETTN